MNVSRIFSAIAVATACSMATFAATEREYIWPDGKMPDAQPHQIGATTAEVKAPGYRADDYRRPYLDWFDAPAADVRTDVCMILTHFGRRLQVLL